MLRSWRDQDDYPVAPVVEPRSGKDDPGQSNDRLYCYHYSYSTPRIQADGDQPAEEEAEVFSSQV